MGGGGGVTGAGGGAFRWAFSLAISAGVLGIILLGSLIAGISAAPNWNTLRVAPCGSTDCTFANRSKRSRGSIEPGSIAAFCLYGGRNSWVAPRRPEALGLDAVAGTGVNSGGAIADATRDGFGRASLPGFPENTF